MDSRPGGVVVVILLIAMILLQFVGVAAAPACAAGRRGAVGAAR
jgi:hypothetical protein